MGHVGNTRMKRSVLTIVFLLSTLACAEEEMMRMAREASERIAASLKAKKIPDEVATIACKLTDNDTPTREWAALALLKHADRKNVLAAMIVTMKEDDNNKRPNA